MDQITYIYDDSGVLTTIENDTNNNDIPDMRSTLTYDDQGNKKTEDVDVGSGFQGSALDGIPDARTTYFYANGNQLQREEFDLDIDEVIDRVTTHRYNDQGWRVRSERDDGADEIIDKYRVYTHDNRGNIVDEDVTREPDGIVEYRYTNTYDDDGNRISRTYDSGADDLIDYRWDFTWNCNDQGGRYWNLPLSETTPP